MCNERVVCLLPCSYTGRTFQFSVIFDFMEKTEIWCGLYHGSSAKMNMIEMCDANIMSSQIVVKQGGALNPKILILVKLKSEKL